MVTKADKRELSQQQLTAIDALVLGSSITDAAEAVGVARPTVSEWVNHDTSFKAGLNRRRAELWTEQADRLRSLVPKALDTIEAYMEPGSAPSNRLKASIAVLRMASGSLNLSDTGKTSKSDLDMESLLSEL